MAGSTRADIIEQVRAKTDLVELIGSYFPLKRTGQNFSACCPFHDEKTPSFMVSPTRQFFHCFGCGEKGSAFDFVMKSERVEFQEALELLAARAHVSLEALAPGTAAATSLRAELYRVHTWAQSIFTRSYTEQAGAACREYVASRGISPEMVRTFGLAFAPPSFGTLSERGGAAGFRPEVLEKSGLSIRGVNRPGLYDRFRDRLTFPIKDSMERIIAFGARTLDGSEPKYLNSPETDLFQKGRTLFGLDRLRNHRRTDPIFVMEGYTDVLMSAQVGVSGAVATLGTALTPDHARLLRRYSDRTILLYDGDRAGLAAAERGALLLLEGGHLDIQVAVLPNGEDPCDFFVARGAPGIEELLTYTTGLLEFLLGRTAARNDLTTTAGRRRAAEDLVRAVAALQDPVARELVLTQVAERLKVSVHALRENAESARSRARPRRSEPETADAAPSPLTSSRLAMLETVQAYINEPVLLDLPQVEDWEAIPDARVRSLLMTLKQLKRDGASTSSALLDLIPDESERELARKALLPEGHGRDLHSVLEGAIRHFKNRRHLEAVQTMKDQLEVGGDDVLRSIQKRFDTLKGRPRPDSGQPGNGKTASEAELDF